MQKRLLFLSGVEGAAVMAAELCGAKLLAPVFGSSLYVWASVMGITLAALAGGYFFGGWLTAQSAAPRNRLFHVLMLAALFLLLMPVLSHYLVPRLSYLSFLVGMVLSTCVLLFLPVFFLGASSPLFIALQAAPDKAGKVSGTVYAVSTTGGILATFLCGFYFIPELGLTLCLLCFGGLLFLATLIVFKIFRIIYLLLCVASVYLSLQFTLKNKTQLLVSDSVLGHLEVLDVMYGHDKPVRLLRVNNIIQTEMSLHTKHSISDYVRLMDTLIPRAETGNAALVLGLGGGLTSNLLVRKGYCTDGVELDHRIIDAARNYFYLQPQVNAVYADARYFLNTCRQKYNVVLVDVFKAEEQPSHVLTLESLKHLKQNLNNTSLLLINWHGYSSADKGKGTAVLYHTLKRSGFYVKLCSLSPNEDRRNLIFVASLQPLMSLPFEVKDSLTNSTGALNKDDRPLLEKYNARANAAWRANYLRFYQQQR